MPINHFTDFEAWKSAHKLTLMIYKLTANFPKTETYSLVDQIRRAAISVTSNIAEGFGWSGYKERAQFYYLSRGSLTEIENQLILSNDLNYLSPKDFNQILETLTTTQKIIQGLINKTKTFIT